MRHTESIDDMTAKALNGLPRSQAIETMIKFNEMKWVEQASRLPMRYDPLSPLAYSETSLKSFWKVSVVGTRWSKRKIFDSSWME